MAKRLSGKKVLVTGAAQGIGAAIARMAAEEGARVMVTDINEDGAARVAAEIDAASGAGTAFSLAQDVCREDLWVDVIARAEDQLAGLTGLVNNAGIGRLGTVESLSYTDWRKIMDVNLDSVYLGTKYVLPALRRHQPGSIVNVSSISALIASHNFAAYNASKAGVWMLTKSVALHCAREGLDIRCNSVHPTFIDTPLLDNLGREGIDRTVLREKLARQVPLGRLGQPEDVAYAAVYLLSDESRFMTGSELKLDGGVSAQ